MSMERDNNQLFSRKCGYKVSNIQYLFSIRHNASVQRYLVKFFNIEELKTKYIWTLVQRVKRYKITLLWCFTYKSITVTRAGDSSEAEYPPLNWKVGC